MSTRRYAVALWLLTGLFAFRVVAQPAALAFGRPSALLGATALGHVRWFASPLPAFFHLVLATYLLLYGYGHVHKVSRKASR